MFLTKLSSAGRLASTRCSTAARIVRAKASEDNSKLLVGSASLIATLGLGIALSSLNNSNKQHSWTKCEKIQLTNYPIGTPGKPWGDGEKKLWLESRKKCINRSYDLTVFGSILEMMRTANLDGFHPVMYGTLKPKGTKTSYPLWAIVPNTFKPRGCYPEHFPIKHYHKGDYSDDEMMEAKSKPTILITGGTHGYEDSGIKGALRFLSSGKAKHYSKFFNIVVVPCISPWSYEHNERWVATADDPNRSFGLSTKSCPVAMRTEESSQLLRFLDSLGVNQRYNKRQGSDNCSEGGELHMPKWLCHIDLHETTNSDVEEFRPAKAARDGLTEYDNHIPDGFYLVGDSCSDRTGNEMEDNNNADHLGFYNAILKAVAGVTHIAEMEPGGKLSGYPATSRGLILVPCKDLGLCGGGAVQDAMYVATTEVYPDSERTTEDDCINAQVIAICGALDFFLKKGVASIPCERS